MSGGIKVKMFLISDNKDTKTGMRIAGVEGVIAHSREEMYDAVKTAIDDKNIGILLFTEKAAELDREYVRNLKMTLHTPIIIEIPDRHGSRDIGTSINSMVSESIGLKL